MTKKNFSERSKKLHPGNTKLGHKKKKMRKKRKKTGKKEQKKKK